MFRKMVVGILVTFLLGSTLYAASSRPSNSCSTMKITSCGSSALMISGMHHGMFFQIRNVDQGERASFVFHEGQTELAVLGRKMRSPMTATFKVVARGTRGSESVEFVPGQFATGDFSVLAPIAQAVPLKFVKDVREIISLMPESTTQAVKLKHVIDGVVSALTHSDSIHPQIAGIFYASCYWACVAGSWEWESCGDYCYKKYGTN